MEEIFCQKGWNTDDITTRQMRALTSSVIKNALIEIRTTHCYRKLKEIENWTRNDKSMWWDCLEFFCGIDVENTKKIIRNKINERRKKIKNHKNARNSKIHI
jgi:hypothetical protein